MEVSGRIIEKLAPQGGTSKAGREWKKQEYVLETHEQYPRKVKFDFFGDKVDQYPLNIGEEVTISFDIESREFNGRWYTDIRAWKADKGQAASQGPQPLDAPAAPGFQPAAPAAPGPQADPFAGVAPAADNGNDDLPF